jgi:hypothetical protein
MDKRNFPSYRGEVSPGLYIPFARWIMVCDTCRVKNLCTVHVLKVYQLMEHIEVSASERIWTMKASTGMITEATDWGIVLASNAWFLS